MLDGNINKVIIITQRYGRYLKKNKSKVYPRTGHEVPDGEQRYNSTLSLTSELDGDRCSTPRLDSLSHGKDPVLTV